MIFPSSSNRVEDHGSHSTCNYDFPKIFQQSYGQNHFFLDVLISLYNKVKRQMIKPPIYIRRNNMLRDLCIRISYDRIFYYFYILATTTTTTTTTTTSTIIRSIYSNALTNRSPLFTRLNQQNNSFYYQSIQLFVRKSAVYTVSSGASIYLHCSLYNNSFNPNNPSNNLITFASHSDTNRNPSFSTYLNTGVTYILVVTTVNPYVTGSFNITVSGVGLSTLSGLTITTTTTITTEATTTGESVKKSTSTDTFTLLMIRDLLIISK